MGRSRLSEAEIRANFQERLARDHKMKTSDPRFWNLLEAAELAAGNLGHNAIEHWFEIFKILMKPVYERDDN